MTRLLSCLALALCSYTLAAQAPAAPVTTTASPEIAQFQKLEDTWDVAINSRDQYSLELVLSPLFVDVAASGDITTRNQQVATLVANDDKTLHIEQKVITVRLLGDIAVANGSYLLHHKVPTGVVDEKGIFTHVFEKVRGGWVCINSQRTAIREDAPGKAKKPSGSKAEEPFHIPFFSKDQKN
ncbi:MAG TPA: nuclear transport factor 2 family protein [Terracidiphilus sp.]|nr:nuclear transport factor 2 family protein [Terracidiphilus sp.]